VRRCFQFTRVRSNLAASPSAASKTAKVFLGDCRAKTRLERAETLLIENGPRVLNASQLSPGFLPLRRVTFDSGGIRATPACMGRPKSLCCGTGFAIAAGRSARGEESPVCVVSHP